MSEVFSYLGNEGLLKGIHLSLLRFLLFWDVFQHPPNISVLIPLYSAMSCLLVLTKSSCFWYI